MIRSPEIPSPVLHPHSLDPIGALVYSTYFNNFFVDQNQIKKVDDIFPSYNYYADLGRKTSNTFVLSTQPKTSSTATVPNIVCDSCFAQHFLLSSTSFTTLTI